MKDWKARGQKTEFGRRIAVLKFNTEIPKDILAGIIRLLPDDAKIVAWHEDPYAQLCCMFVVSKCYPVLGEGQLCPEITAEAKKDNSDQFSINLLYADGVDWQL